MPTFQVEEENLLFPIGSGTQGKFPVKWKSFQIQIKREFEPTCLLSLGESFEFSLFVQWHFTVCKMFFNESLLMSQNK